MREATFKVRVPADLLAFGFSEEQVQSQIREWLVLSLFTEERISSGKAAQPNSCGVFTTTTKTRDILPQL